MDKIDNKKIIGIDFGAKKIGIAVSDKNRNFALPKLVLQNDKNLMKRVEEIIQRENVSEIVMGESTNYSGEENTIMESARKFADKIKKRFNLPINYEPEFLTSSQVRNTQGDSKMIDASAAALILQSFLDKRNNK